MEKPTPHCRLSVVRTLVSAGKVRSTMSALSNAAALGFDFDGMLRVVMSLTPRDFHKSMTTHRDHRIWQDVYRTRSDVGVLYLKLTVVDDLLIVSFKEL
jgi:motility quorum-sensing regulator/GCU-specific mRNA interferase toxin